MGVVFLGKEGGVVKGGRKGDFGSVVGYGRDVVAENRWLHCPQFTPQNPQLNLTLLASKL